MPGLRRACLALGMITFVALPASSQTLEWTATRSGPPVVPLTHPFWSSHVVVDTGGYAYTAGTVSGGAFPRGWLGRFTPSGQLDWSATVDGYPIELLLDDQQRPLLVGERAISKYSTGGALLWRTSLVPPPPLPADQGSLRVHAAAAGPAGGVYVAGDFWDAAGSYELAVARYDGAGRRLWLHTWSGPAGLEDRGEAISVDAAGQVYVAGRTQTHENPAATEVVLMSFDAAGTLLWRRNAEAGATPAIAAFRSGGLLVAGLESGFVADWRLTRYDSAGTIVWAATGDGAAITEHEVLESMATSPDGAIYFTGHTEPSGLPLAGRVGLAGVEWVKKGAQPVRHDLHPAQHLAVDAASHALVAESLPTGQLRTTVYEPSGTVGWSRDLDGATGVPPVPYELRVGGAAVGPAGEVRLSATRVTSFGGVLETIAYGAAGGLEWRQTPPLVGQDQSVRDVRADGAGNAVALVAGITADHAPLMRLLKYDPDGGLAWERESPGTPARIAVGAAGEVVVAGSTGAANAEEFVVAKYDASGALAWTRTYRPPGFDDLAPGTISVGLDAAGNAYVLGLPWYPSVPRAAVLKYSPDGNLLWSRTSPDYFELGFLGSPTPHLVVAPDGGTVVGGWGRRLGVSGKILWALDAAGQTRWTYWDPANGSEGIVTALALDGQGNVLAGSRDGNLVKLSSAGSVRWQANDRGIVTAIDSDPASAVFAVRYLFDFGLETEISHYSPTGTRRWSRPLRTEAMEVGVQQLRAGSEGQVYAGGFFVDRLLGVSGWYLGKLDPDGNAAWGRRVAGFLIDLAGGSRLVVAGERGSAAGGVEAVVQSVGDEPPMPADLHTVPPCRVFDSREATLGGPSPVAARAAFEAQVAGRCGIPATARSVALNVTVTESSAAGHLILFPAGRVPPVTSNVNYVRGQTRATQAVLALGDEGRLALGVVQEDGAAHVILDVSGYFE